MNKQHIELDVVHDKLKVQGQRARIHPETLFSYFSTNRLTSDNQQQTGLTSMTSFLKDSKRDEEKRISNEKFSTRSQYSTSSNVYQLAKSSVKGNPSPTSRSSTAPLILEESIDRTISARIKSTSPFRSSSVLRASYFIDSTEDLRSSSSFQLRSPTLKNNNYYGYQLDVDTNNSYLDLSIDFNENDETIISDRNHKMNGFQHIVNLGSWQRNSKAKQMIPSAKFKELEYEDDDPADIDPSPSKSSQLLYEYKSPFSEEYDQAISSQAQSQTNTGGNEWDLKEFYRDVKTDFEFDTNTKPVFEKCLKLARLQANTVKWEQRRRQNLNIYNRLIKNSPLDNNVVNLNGSFSFKNNNNDKDYKDINELRRELRCNECKRIACLGNCAPGQEYHQYKRFIPFIPLATTREPIRCKLNVRTQRSTSDVRPRSTQQILRDTKYKFDQTNPNPVVIVPLFADDTHAKRPQKKLPNNLLHGKTLRSQRREVLTLISTYKILS